MRDYHHKDTTHFYRKNLQVNIKINHRANCKIKLVQRVKKLFLTQYKVFF